MKEQIPRPTMKQDDIIKQVISMKDLHKKFVNLMEATLRFGQWKQGDYNCSHYVYEKYLLKIQTYSPKTIGCVFTWNFH